MNDVPKGYLRKNILIIKDDINDESVEYVKEAFSMLYLKGSPNITILISSEGGSVDAGLDIVDILSLYPGKKTAIVIGCASSMAAVILQVCDERKATPHSSILIHHINRRRIGLDVLRDKKKTDALLKSMEKSQERLYKILAKKTGRNVKEIRVECEKNRHMTVDEAIAFGLLDGVYQGPLPK
jgi:ATP-dependent Clp protease protease subunit